MCGGYCPLGDRSCGQLPYKCTAWTGTQNIGETCKDTGDPDWPSSPTPAGDGNYWIFSNHGAGVQDEWSGNTPTYGADWTVECQSDSTWWGILSWSVGGPGDPSRAAPPDPGGVINHVCHGTSASIDGYCGSGQDNSLSGSVLPHPIYDLWGDEWKPSGSFYEIHNNMYVEGTFTLEG